MPVICSKGDYPSTTLSSTGKPLVKRPVGHTYKTILSVDGGGIRGLLSSVVIIEIEKSIKRYLLSHPQLLPSHANISSIDDFDINLVDYFDCMTGISAGGWTVLYLASRGGQGEARTVLENPDIVAKYGAIPAGGAEALRVLFKEYSDVIYPVKSLDLKAGIPMDQTNPNAPGVRTPLFPTDGLESTLEAFCGNATLEDIDTSLIVPAYDLARDLTVYFVQNRFKAPAATSSAQLKIRSGPRSVPVNGAGFAPDLVFDEGKNYYLKDIGVATGAVPAINPAKNMTPVGSENVEFVLVDGLVAIETTDFPSNVFVISENGLEGIEKVATLSVSTGRAERSYLDLANSGADKWMGDNTFLWMSVGAGFNALPALMDYLYYGNRNVKPNQYLRVQTSAPDGTEEGRALANVVETTFLDLIEKIGEKTAQEYRSSIDSFVKNFIFG